MAACMNLRTVVKAAWILTAVVTAVAPAAQAEIIVQIGNGNWVSSYGLNRNSPVMPSIVLTQTVHGNGGFLAQRALSWSSYKHLDKGTGILLTDPMGSGAATAANARQSALRAHLARANAYRLGYFAR